MTGHERQALIHARRPTAVARGVQANRREAETLADDLRSIEAVIKLIEPNFNVRRIAPKRRNWPSPPFKKGQCFENVLAVLREARAPLSVYETIDELPARRASQARPQRIATAA